MIIGKLLPSEDKQGVIIISIEQINTEINTEIINIIHYSEMINDILS